MTLTRGQLKAQGRLLLGETRGTAGDGDPFSLDFLLTMSADVEASSVGALYLPYYMDITANQVDYTWPDGLQRLVTAMAYSAEGTNVKLQQFTADQFDHMQDVWEVSPEYGDPYAMIQKGGTRFQLYPIPNYASSCDPETFVGGMCFSGWGVPGGSWANDGANCPLPSFGQYAALYGALVERCKQFPDEAQYASRLPGFMQSYNKFHGLFESAVATQSQASRHRDDVSVDTGTSWSGNPLNVY